MGHFFAHVRMYYFRRRRRPKTKGDCLSMSYLETSGLLSLLAQLHHSLLRLLLPDKPKKGVKSRSCLLKYFNTLDMPDKS